MLGKCNYPKFVAGFNYVLSKANYAYESSSTSPYPYNNAHVSREKYNVKTNIHFLNIMLGMRFSIFKRLHLEPLISGNFPVLVNNKITGYHNTYDLLYNGPMMPSNATNHDTVFYNNSNVKEYDLKPTTVSFSPRVTYDFNLKQHKLGVYFSSNFAAKYRLQWNTLGIMYYTYNNRHRKTNSSKL